jgi:hypothetical protein
MADKFKDYVSERLRDPITSRPPVISTFPRFTYGQTAGRPGLGTGFAGLRPPATVEVEPKGGGKLVDAAGVGLALGLLAWFGWTIFKGNGDR